MDDSLARDCLELIWSIDKSGSDPVGELDCREEVAYTKAKAHRGFDYNAVIVG
jgi:hypothetical protein